MDYIISVGISITDHIKLLVPLTLRDPENQPTLGL